MLKMISTFVQAWSFLWYVMLNTRLNSLTSNKESTLTEVSASNDAIVDAPSQTNATTS